MATFNLSNFQQYQIKYYLPVGIFLSGISLSRYLVCQTPLSVVAVMTACCHVLRTEAEWAVRINTRYTSMSVIFIPAAASALLHRSITKQCVQNLDIQLIVCYIIYSTLHCILFLPTPFSRVTAGIISPESDHQFARCSSVKMIFSIHTARSRNDKKNW